MRILVVLLLAGCASIMPKGGWNKECAQPGEMSKDWNDCYTSPNAGWIFGYVGYVLARSAARSSAEECMSAKGWK